MKAVWRLAQTSLREMLREKIFFVAFGGALFLVLLSLLLGEMSLDESERLLADLGFAGVELAVSALALFSGSFLLARELDRQTCLLILSKPVSRQQFLLGKWLGTAMLVFGFVIVLSMTMALLIGRWWGGFLPVAASIFVKSLILLSWSLFVSTFARPILALLSGVSLYLLGHWLGDLAVFAEKSGDPIRIWIVKNLRWVVPNFDLYNWKSHFHLVETPLLRDILGMALQGVAFCAVFLILAGFFFRRKDLV
ncbi:MAG: ABC transporter permease subunit [Bdellovibrionaceae bacterium]|nr:ABC transporter permease subunit [Pseudobdellovibrionaceae bacterium]